MHTNQVYIELDTVNNGLHKWWHRRWVKIIGIFIIILIIFAVTLTLMLNFVIFAPNKSETSTTIATSSSPLTTTTVSLVTPTTTLPRTTATITTQQS
ncbi:unnamed protein product, partial [Adineta steineri]